MIRRFLFCVLIALGSPLLGAEPREPATWINSIGMKLRRVPAGEFWMGTSGDAAIGRADERPRHKVRITKPFSIGVYEVTQQQFQRVMGFNPSFFSHTGRGKSIVGDLKTCEFPADQVTWRQAHEFCRKLSALTAEQTAKRVYRLPTEAEWEYACRAGTGTAFSFGDRLSSAQANFNGKYPFGGAAKGPFLARTAAVGSYAPNPWGLFDMHGNVWEWCRDWYGAEYYKVSPAEDPVGPKSGSYRVIRGGGWYSDARDCTSRFRNSEIPGKVFYVMGFRVVLTTGGATPLAENAAAQLGSAVDPEVAADNDQPIGDGEPWPRWRGPRGDGTWNGPKLPDKWPANGLKRIWRQPVGGGYSGVAAVDGRVFTMDRQKEPQEVERVLCFDAASGKRLWTHEYAVKYGDLSYGNGPRAMPTVIGGRVYTLGAVGHVFCLDVANGHPVWSVDAAKQFDMKLPMWGLAASPVVFNELVIIHIGAKPNGSFVAFNRHTGKRVWRSLDDDAGYATPILIESGGIAQLVCWTPQGIRGLDPRTGKLLWKVPFVVTYGTSIATPIFQEGIVFISNYWEGSLAIRLGKQPTNAEVIWEDRRNLRGLMSQPLYREGHVFSLDKRNGLTGFELKTGKIFFDDDNRMTPKGRNPQATMVWLGDADRAIVLNSEGELILARLNPNGYHEQSRTKIIGQTWAHPAYFGNRVYARSDTELVCVLLVEAAGAKE